MNSIKELQERIDPAYEAVLNSINKNKEMPVIIWGTSTICNQLINYINGRLPITVWDSRTAGKRVKGYTVVKPQFNLSDEIKQKAYVIMAFTAPKNYIVCGKMLEDNGFLNRVNGEELLSHITASKALNDYKLFKELNTDPDFKIDDDNLSFRVDQAFLDAGASFYDTEILESLWAAKKIHADMPKKHYDIGSNVKLFVTHILSFSIETVLIDVRPFETAGIENLTFVQADATNLLEIRDASVESLSSMNAVVSFGLGRYNDPIDPCGHLKTFESMQRVLKHGGNLYISVLISNRNYLLFNRHRVFKPCYLVEKLNEMELIEFSIASTTKGLLTNQSMDLPDSGDDCGYYKGLYHFKKK